MSKSKKPPSLKKILANQENAKKSTGPTSEAGKYRSSQNAVILAIFAETDLLLWEDPKERAEFAEAILSRLQPATALQELKAAQIVNRAWLARRSAGIKNEFLNHEVAMEVMDREFPLEEPTEDDWPMRSAQARKEVLAKHRRKLVPTREDVEVVMHRLFDERSDLIDKMDKMSLQHERALTRLLDDYDRLKEQERAVGTEGTRTFQEPTLGVFPDPWESQQSAWNPDTPSNNDHLDPIRPEGDGTDSE